MAPIYKRLWVRGSKRWIETVVKKAATIVLPMHPVLARKKDGPFLCDTCTKANQELTRCVDPYIVAKYPGDVDGAYIGPGDCCDFHVKGPRGTSIKKYQPGESHHGGGNGGWLGQDVGTDPNGRNIQAQEFKNIDTRKDEAKAAAKQADKDLRERGFVKEGSSSKHTPSQPMGRSEAYSGTSDQKTTTYSHPDGRQATLSHYSAKYSPHRVVVRVQHPGG